MFDSDMPRALALGVTWQASERLMIAADVKDVMWASSMNTVISYNQGVAVAPFQQDSDDRIVLALGLSYAFSDDFVGRIGYYHGTNPIPDRFVNLLWPAIVEDHCTAGFGYAFSKQSALNAALSYVPQATVTGTGPMNGGMLIDHSPLNWQLMDGYTF